MKRSTIDYYDSEELAAYICGVYLNYLEEQELSEDDATMFVDTELQEQFGVSLESFHALLTYMLPLVAMGRSELTQKLYRGFVVDGVYVVKEEVK